MSLSKPPHLVFLPSGLGNSTPLLRLAVKVASSLDCKVTLINVQPRPFDPEVSSFSRIELLDFEIKDDALSKGGSSDPFIERCEKINRSLYKLSPILSSLQASAIVTDFAVAATMAKLSADLNIALFVLSTTSAKFFSLVSCLPSLLSEDSRVFSDRSLQQIEIPGLGTVMKSNIPTTWRKDLASNHLLTSYLLPNSRALSRVDGVFLNTFDWFEQETIAALNGGSVLRSLPRVFPIGPLRSYEPESSLPWLDSQPDESVVFVDLGSTETMPGGQLAELKKGLETCSHDYLWLIKGEHMNVKEIDIQELHGHKSESSSDDSLEERGKIVRGRLDQERVLAHRAVGGFISQCEWDSIMHAAHHGVPVLAWPGHGDQMMSADIVEKTGLGFRVVEDLPRVGGKEICRLVRRLMEDSDVRKKAGIVRNEARDSDCCENISIQLIALRSRKN